MSRPHYSAIEVQNMIYHNKQISRCIILKKKNDLLNKIKKKWLMKWFYLFLDKLWYFITYIFYGRKHNFL